MIALKVKAPKNCHECDSFGISDIWDIDCGVDSDTYDFDKRPDFCPIIVLTEREQMMIELARRGKLK